MNDLTLIEKLCNARGMSGFEDEVLQIAREYCKEFATFEEDSMRNLYIYPTYNKGGRPLVLLDAHTDEVGFMVQGIKPDGTLKFIPVGGWNEKALPSSKVQVSTKNGYVSGIIAATPPHLMTAEQRNAPVSINDLVIDIGADNAENAIEMGVSVGSAVVPLSGFEYNQKQDILMGKAFDDRLGVASVLITLKNLQNCELNVDIVGVLSSQEEVGTRGIKAVMVKIKPDIAICLEGCPADDITAPSYMIQAGLKKGVMLRYMDTSVICTPRFNSFAIEVAEKNDIKIQLSVRSGGGNNGMAIINGNGATPVIVASIPVRYIHTFNCIASLSDFISAHKLATAICKNLTSEIIKSF